MSAHRVATAWALGLALGCNRPAVDRRPRAPEPAAERTPARSDAGPPEPATGPSTPASWLEAPRGSLDGLYAALDRAERRAPDGRALLVFFGDSHTAGDRLTGAVRRRLGERFGDAGRGFVLPGRPPMRHYYLRDVRYGSSGTWRVEIGGKKDNHPPFGLGGVRVHADRRDARAWVESCDGCGSDRVARFDIYYLRTPTSGVLRYQIDGGAWRTHATRRRGDEPAVGILPVPVREGQHRLTVAPGGGGPIELFGIALERATAGVVVDALGVVGRRLSQLRSWDWEVIGPQLAARDPALVVLQYGTNEASDRQLDLAAVARHYDDVIASIRRHAPETSIVLLGPPDMAVRDGGRTCDRAEAVEQLEGGVAPECVWHTPPVLEAIVAMQRETAARNQVAFFDSFAALGGRDQIDGFARRDPPLAYSDHVHWTQAGAELWAAALVDALLAGYPAWRTGSGGPS